MTAVKKLPQIRCAILLAVPVLWSQRGVGSRAVMQFVGRTGAASKNQWLWLWLRRRWRLNARSAVVAGQRSAVVTGLMLPV